LQTLTPQEIEAVANVLNKRFSVSTPFSRAYLRATVNEIRVTGDFLKVIGADFAFAFTVPDGKRFSLIQKLPHTCDKCIDFAVYLISNFFDFSCA
jgi:hypothetical protein